MSAPAPQHGGATAARLERVVVTRPASEAAIWTLALQAEGWPAQTLPLIEVAAPHGGEVLAALQRARAHWLAYDALMFVSAAAVRHFFAQGVACAAGQVSHTRFWAPGPGTAQALSQALVPRGVDARQIDAPPADAAQFDSEALWPVVEQQLRPGARVLIVRGQSEGAVQSVDSLGQVAGSGRDWLIRQCTGAGAQVEGCVAYVRRAPAFSQADRQLAAAASGAGNLWLLSSSEALVHLHALAPATGWERAHALATHPRIAHSARAAGFGRVIESRPALADVLRALESQWSRP